MTGKDQVLNRRITSIFVNELENARNQVLAINQENLPALEFTMHKVRPSLLIFEQEFISKEFEALLDLYKTDPDQEGLSDKFPHWQITWRKALRNCVIFSIHSVKYLHHSRFQKIYCKLPGGC